MKDQHVKFQKKKKKLGYLLLNVSHAHILTIAQFIT